MGLFDNMYAKRRAKLIESAAPLLGEGEVVGATAICQPQKQASMAAFGGNQVAQFLATATEENFYLFVTSPFKANEVVDHNVNIRPMAGLDAQMDGKKRAVIGEFHLASLRVEAELQELVAFIQQHNAQ